MPKLLTAQAQKKNLRASNRPLLFMDPITTGALISGGSSVLGNLLGFGSNSSTNKTNMKIAQMNNDWNYKMFKEQQQYNLDMWNKENAYNTPEMQAQRLRDAGLNPGLIMGSGNTGNASSVGGVTPPTAQGATMQPFRPDFTGVANAAQNYILNRTSEQQLQNDKARLQIEEGKVMAEIADIMVKGRETQERTQYQRKLNSWIDRLNQSQIENQRADTQQKKAAAALSSEQTNLMCIQTLIATKQLGYMDEQHQMSMAQCMADISLKYAQQANVEESTKLTSENIKKVSEEIKEVSARTYGIKLSNKEAQNLAPFVLKRAQLDAIPNAEQNFRMHSGSNPVQTFFDGLQTIVQPYIPFAK